MRRGVRMTEGDLVLLCALARAHRDLGPISNKRFQVRQNRDVWQLSHPDLTNRMLETSWPTLNRLMSRGYVDLRTDSQGDTWAGPTDIGLSRCAPTERTNVGFLNPTNGADQQVPPSPDRPRTRVRRVPAALDRSPHHHLLPSQMDIAMATIGAAVLAAALTGLSGWRRLGAELLSVVMMTPFAFSYIRYQIATHQRFRLRWRHCVIVISLALGFGSYYVAFEIVWTAFRKQINFELFGHTLILIPSTQQHRVLVAWSVLAVMAGLFALFASFRSSLGSPDYGFMKLVKQIFVSALVLLGSLFLILGSFDEFGCIYFSWDGPCNVFEPTPTSRWSLWAGGIGLLVLAFGIEHDLRFTRVAFRSRGRGLMAVGVAIGLAIAALVPPGRLVTHGESDLRTPSVDSLDANASHTGQQIGPGVAGSPVELWRVMTGTEEVRATGGVVDGIYFFGAGDYQGKGAVYAVELATGQRRWRAEMPGMIWENPVATQAAVYVCSANAITALDTRRGSVVWSTPLGASCSAPTVWGDTLFVTDSIGNLYACDLATGGVRWQQRFAFGSQSSPAVRDAVVYAAGGDESLDAGVLLAFDTETGQPWWQYEFKGFPITDVTLTQGSLLVGTRTKASDLVDVKSGHVIRVDSATRREVWRSDMGAEVPYLAIAGNTVLVPANGRLHALSLENGDEQWQTDDGTLGVLSSPVVVDGKVYVSSWTSGSLLALRLEDGLVQWRHQVGPGMNCGARPVVIGGVALVGCARGIVVAVGSKPATALDTEPTTAAVATPAAAASPPPLPREAGSPTADLR